MILKLNRSGNSRKKIDNILKKPHSLAHLLKTTKPEQKSHVRVNIPDMASRTSEDECKWYWHQMIYFPETIKQ
jgi:hypothetical protein